MNRTSIITALRRSGWAIQESPDAEFQLPPEISRRYPELPKPLKVFLSGLRSCVDPGNTTWFLCQPDFDGTSNAAFRWNEWEELSIQAARSEKDSKWEAQIFKFWDKHFPFMLSVADGYGFTAVCVAPDHFGKIVRGHEPEFEEVTVIADSVEQFLEGLVHETTRGC